LPGRSEIARSPDERGVDDTGGDARAKAGGRIEPAALRHSRLLRPHEFLGQRNGHRDERHARGSQHHERRKGDRVGQRHGRPVPSGSAFLKKGSENRGERQTGKNERALVVRPRGVADDEGDSAGQRREDTHVEVIRGLACRPRGKI
jgi:hypothetical protein